MGGGWSVPRLGRFIPRRDLVPIVKVRITEVYAIEGGELDELEEPTNI